MYALIFYVGVIVVVLIGIYFYSAWEEVVRCGGKVRYFSD